MRDVYKQLDWPVRFDWGPEGAQAIGPEPQATVIVDVLSFTTTVSVAVSRGMHVLPYRWKDETARAYAQSEGAMLAVGRSEMDDAHPWSLSAAALRTARFTPRLVLPSPNGSAIATAAAGTVVAASLRNAGAVVAHLVASGFGVPEQPILVVAAGERWAADDSLRPALEDLLGAGALLAGLQEAGCSLSPEARAAAATFGSMADETADVVRASASGRELIEDGYADDVDTAVQLDADEVVPVLRGNAFVDARQADLPGR